MNVQDKQELENSILAGHIITPKNFLDLLGKIKRKVDLGLYNVWNVCVHLKFMC
jgi:hypothetical protein